MPQPYKSLKTTADVEIPRMRNSHAEIGLTSKWYHSQTPLKVQVNSHLGDIVDSFCDLIWCDDLATSRADCCEQS